MEMFLLCVSVVCSGFQGGLCSGYCDASKFVLNTLVGHVVFVTGFFWWFFAAFFYVGFIVLLLCLIDVGERTYEVAD